MPNPIVIQVQMVAELEQARSALQRVATQTEAMAGSMQRAGAVTVTAGRAMDSIKGNIEGVGAALAALGAFVGIREMTREAIQSARAHSQLEAALRSSGQASADFREELARQRKELSDLVGVDDDQILAVQRQLVTYKVAADQIQTLTQLTLDYAAAMGVDAASAAITMGRALSGESIELRGLRVEIDSSLPRYQQVNQLIDTLSRRVGDQARSAFEDAAPEVTRFGLAMQEAKKAWGAFALQFFGPELKAGTFLLEKAREAAEGLREALTFSPFTSQEEALAANAPMRRPLSQRGREMLDAGGPEPEGENNQDRILRLQKIAAEAAATETAITAAIHLEQQKNEQAYQLGQISLASYLERRKALILQESSEEQLPLRKAIDATTAQILRQRDALQSAIDSGQDETVVRSLRAELDKLTAQKEALESKVAAVQLGAKANLMITGGDPFSFTEQWGAALKQLREQFGTTAQIVARTFKDTITSITSTIGDGITGLIEGTKKWGDVMKEIAHTLLSNFVNAVVNMVAQWILAHVTMGTASEAFRVTETASTALHAQAQVGIHDGAEAAKTASTGLGTVLRGALRLGETIFHGVQVGLRVAAHIAGEVFMTIATVAQAAIRMGIILAETLRWLVQAAIKAGVAVASIPYVGPFLAVAAFAAVMAAGLKLAGAFEEGGYTGDGGRHEPAGIVHKGEFVFSQPAVQRIGRDNLEAMHRGQSITHVNVGTSGQAQPKEQKRETNISFAILNRESEIPDWARDSKGEKHIVDMVRRNWHTIRGG